MKAKLVVKKKKKNKNTVITENLSGSPAQYTLTQGMEGKEQSEAGPES